jgi:riboflavin biosynthesis pyrimidine reductase
LDLPWDAGLFQAADQPILLYTGADGNIPDVPAPVEVVRVDTSTPAEALADLRARDVRALACEGGPVLLRALIAAGLVDELFLTLTPLITGERNAPRIVEGDDLPVPLGMKLVWTLRHEDELYLRYSISRDG